MYNKNIKNTFLIKGYIATYDLRSFLKLYIYIFSLLCLYYVTTLIKKLGLSLLVTFIFNMA